MGRQPLMDEVAQHDQHDELERRQLADLALTEQAEQPVDHEEHRGGAKDYVHQGRTLVLSGSRTNSLSPSNTATTPRLVPIIDVLTWKSILTTREIRRAHV